MGRERWADGGEMWADGGGGRGKREVVCKRREVMKLRIMRISFLYRGII